MSTLAGSRCTVCGRAWLPVRDACPACGSPLEAASLAADGELVSWTRVHVAPEGFDGAYVVGVIALPETRVLARGADGDDLAIGRRVIVHADGDTLAFRVAE